MNNDEKVAGLPEEWPEYVMLRDTGLHDDMGGLGQRIYTTAGAGYTKRKYIREDMAALSAHGLPVMAVPDDIGLYQGQDDCPHLQIGGVSVATFPAGSWPAVCEAMDSITGSKPAEAVDGCRCQSCGDLYVGDLLVPDEVWEKVAGSERLLCASCLLGRIVDAGIWSAARATSVDAAQGAVAWCLVDTAGYHVYTSDPKQAEQWRGPGWTVTPLYTHPHPTPDTTAAELLGLADEFQDTESAKFYGWPRWMTMCADKLRTIAGEIKESGT